MYPSAVQHSVLSTIRIIKLVVMRSGTYNPMYYRPYETHFDADTADALQGRMEANGPNTTTSSLMAGIANRIIMPSMQHQGQIPIVNGWETPRGRFNMVVEIKHHTGSTVHYYIQGYTSHFDTSHLGTPDPEMQFFINSYVKISRTEIRTANGIETREIVTDSAQVINGRLTSNLLQKDIYGMRPNEIYSMMQQDVLMGKYYNPEYPDQLQDRRHILSNQNVPNYRRNNMPANILAKMVDSYQTTQQLIEYGQDSADLLSRSRGYVYEGTLQENGFFKQLSNISGTPETTSFTMNHLRHIDPNIDSPSVSTFFTLSPLAMQKLHYPGQTEFWHRPNDRSAWVASVLVNAVPTIMMDLMIWKLSFRASNHDSMGVNNVAFDGGADIMGRDMSAAFNAFKYRFIHEVMHDVTYGNQELYMLTMSVDMIGETIIDIAYGNEPVTRYVTPSFCDSLMTPVITPNMDNLTNTVYDFTEILKTVGGSVNRPLINETV